MIDIKIKEDCCGCESCVQRCPKQCISMYEDEEGFLYPKVDHDLCIECGLCEKVCPIINQGVARKPLKVYAAKNNDDQVRLQSSSGGIFTILAEYVIDKGGIVFGVKYNEHWEAVHGYTETKTGIRQFRMSKYIQSRVDSAYQDAEKFLKQGRMVLFSGTPCQILGLKRFLKKEYSNLFLVDFICHGTPSPGVFRWYVGEQISKILGDENKPCLHRMPINKIPSIDIYAKEHGVTINNILFRDKRKGWENFSLVLDYSISKSDNSIISREYSSISRENPFLKGFLTNLYLRPSCYSCPVKSLSSGSDFTLGDFWGIKTLLPQLDDDRGVSIVIVNTLKAKDLMNEIYFEKYETDYDIVCEKNISILKSSLRPVKRKDFFLQTTEDFFSKVNRLTRVSVIKKCFSKLRSSCSKTFRFLIGDDFVRILKKKILK